MVVIVVIFIFVVAWGFYRPKIRASLLEFREHQSRNNQIYGTGVLVFSCLQCLVNSSP